MAPALQRARALLDDNVCYCYDNTQGVFVTIIHRLGVWALATGGTFGLIWRVRAVGAREFLVIATKVATRNVVSAPCGMLTPTRALERRHFRCFGSGFGGLPRGYGSQSQDALAHLKQQFV